MINNDNDCILSYKDLSYKKKVWKNNYRFFNRQLCRKPLILVERIIIINDYRGLKYEIIFKCK